MIVPLGVGGLVQMAYGVPVHVQGFAIGLMDDAGSLPALALWARTTTNERPRTTGQSSPSVRDEVAKHGT